MSRIILINCTLFLFSFSLGATSIDSLQQLLQQSTSTIEQIELTQTIAEALANSDLKAAHQYYWKAHRLASPTDNMILYGETQTNLGQSYAQLSQYDSALFYLQEAVLHFSKMSTPHREGIARAKLEMAKVYNKQTDLDVAMKLYFEALEIWEGLDRPVQIAAVYNGIADVLYIQSDYKQSADYCEKAIVLLEPLNDWETLGKTYLNLGYAWLIMSDYDYALECMQKSLEYAQKAKFDVEAVFSAYNGIGNVYKYMEKLDLAEQYYKKGLELGQQTGYKRALSVCRGNLGQLLLMKKKYQEALTPLLAVIQQNLEANDLKNLWENYMHTSDAYAGLEDYKNAYKYWQLYSEEVERLYEEEIDQMELELTAKYEAGERAAVLVLQEQQLEQQKKIQWLTFGVLGLLVVVLLLGWRNYRNKQRSNRLLTETNTQLAKKNDENKLLLKEIHHRVKNNLQTISSLLNLQSAQISDPQIQNAVKESQSRVRSMALIHQKLYQGENLAAVEMKDYLETLGQSTLNAFGQSAQYVKIDVDMQPLEMDVDTAIPLGLIVNELLTNALKYAFPNQQNGKINLSLTQTNPGHYQLQVADNGVGMSETSSTSSQGTGFGTRLVQLLTMQLQGTISKLTEGGLTTTIRFNAKA